MVRINNKQKKKRRPRTLTVCHSPLLQNDDKNKNNLLDPSFLLMMLLMKPILSSVQMTPIPHITSLAILTCFIRFLGHGTSSIKLLLHDCLGGNDFCKALESRCLQP